MATSGSLCYWPDPVSCSEKGQLYTTYICYHYLHLQAGFSVCPKHRTLQQYRGGPQHADDHQYYKDAASSSRLLCVLTPAFCPLQGLSQTCGQSLTCIRSLTALPVHHPKCCGMQNAVTAEGEKPSTSLLSSEPSDFHLPQVRGNTPGVSGAPAQ